jgi:transcriptional regulator
MPSTYYYTAVHGYGPLHLQTDAERVAWLGVLINRMEAPIPNRWKVTEIARSEVTRRLPSILGFELRIERIEGKFKLGQDEPKKDALAVAEHLAHASDPAHRALGETTRRYNAARPDTETK